ncbi:MAG: hypothetical protein ACREQW_08535 [Candidatus Binatia bacterium]
MPEIADEEEEQDSTKGAADEAQRAADSVAGEFLIHLGHRIKDIAGKMRDESLQEAVRSTTTRIADGLESAGRYLEEEKFDNVVTDVIRRYPVQSVFAGMAVGFFLARKGGK